MYLYLSEIIQKAKYRGSFVKGVQKVSICFQQNTYILVKSVKKYTVMVLACDIIKMK